MDKKPLFHMRPLAMAALGMLTGTLMGKALAAPAAYWVAGGLMALGLAVALFNRRGLTILLAFAALSLTLVALRAPAPFLEGEHAISGRICETPEQRDGSWLLTLDHVTADGEARPGRLRLYVRGHHDPRYGQWIETRGRFWRPKAELLDSYAYWRVYATGETAGYAVTGESPGPYGLLLWLRGRAAAQIDRLFPTSGGVAVGMLLGDKSGIDETTMEAYRATGSAHLLAVSGLHVSVLASAWALLFRRRPWLRFGLTAAFLAFYAALTAFSPSVLRASLMLLCWQLATPLKMPEDRLSALSLAFVIVLLINPYALFYAGFQLSFLAAYGLALLSPMLRDRLSRFGSSFAGVASGSIAVWIATLPAQAAFFGRAPLLSLAGSLFILPIVPFFLIPAFVLTLLSFISFPFAEALAFLPRWALMAIDAIARLGAEFRLALPAPTLAAMLFYLAGILFVSRLCMRSRARRALYGGACFLAAVILWML